MVYDKKRLHTASVGQKKFKVVAEQKDDEHFIKIEANDKNYNERSMWIQDEAVTRSSFVVEALVEDSVQDCFGTHPGLVSFKCKGDITIREKQTGDDL